MEGRFIPSLLSGLCPIHSLRKGSSRPEEDKIASEGTEAVYLSICSDVLDFAFNPGGPVDGNGLTSYELVELVHEFAKLGIRGIDYVEVYPQQDTNDNSSHFVSTVVLYALAGRILNQQK